MTDNESVWGENSGGGICGVVHGETKVTTGVSTGDSGVTNVDTGRGVDVSKGETK